MRTHLTRTVVAMVVFGAAVFGTTACSIDVRGEDAVVREEKRFTVTGQPDVRLRTFDGSIRLRSWDRNEILVEIERRGPDTETAKALVVDTSQKGNTVVVEVPEPRNRREVVRIGSWQSPSVSLVVTVPRRLTLDANTGDGSIAADSLAGTLTLNTGDGSISIRGVEGALKAHTGDGSVQVGNAAGRVEVQTGDGSVDVGGRFELLDVQTGDGSVRVRADTGSVVKSDWTISTGDGAIDVDLPSNIDAELDAHSSDGRVSANGFTGLSTNDRDDDSGFARGRLGKGGRSLRVRSGDGSISINRR